MEQGIISEKKGDTQRVRITARTLAARRQRIGLAREGNLAWGLQWD